jgi:DNA-binding protein H-NS
VEELTEELEQKEDQIVNLKDDIAELQIEIEELKEAQTASAAVPAPASGIDLTELLAGSHIFFLPPSSISTETANTIRSLPTRYPASPHRVARRPRPHHT